MLRSYVVKLSISQFKPSLSEVSAFDDNVIKVLVTLGYLIISYCVHVSVVFLIIP